MDFPDHPFWDFSLRVYESEGVAPACLELQERHSIDVNFVLFCCWLGHAGCGAQGDGRIARLHDTVLPWHADVVRPLRAVRHRLKEGWGEIPAGLAEALRRRVGEIEIDAEHAEQLALAAALGDVTMEPVDAAQAARDAAANLASYFAVCGIAADDADRRALTVILRAAFPALDAAEAQALAEGVGA